MAPAQLSLFPAPSSGLSRKISLRRSSDDNTPNAAGQLSFQGVAFQVVSSTRTPARVHPAEDTIKHSLFCDPSANADLSPIPDTVPTFTSPRLDTSTTANLEPIGNESIGRQRRTRNKSSPRASTLPQDSAQSTPQEEDQLSELPVNTDFGSSSPQKRALRPQMQRMNKPQPIFTSVQAPATELARSPINDEDKLSPLPDKTNFKAASIATSTENPSSVRSRSTSPATVSKKNAHPMPIRSMFPIYDPTKPMDQQNYYPSASTGSHTPSQLGDKLSISGVQIGQGVMKRNDSGVGLVDRYEHIPAAAHGDLEALWTASVHGRPVAGRKAQFGLYQPPGNGRCLAIGTSMKDLIYSMSRDTTSAQSVGSLAPKQFAIKKFCPTAPQSLPTALLVLPQKDHNGKDSKETTTIFPQAAVIDAIEAAASSPRAQHIATFDPAAKSTEAAQLARDVVAEVRRMLSCELVKKNRKRDSLGAVTARYDLIHPALGVCAVTVTKSLSLNSISGPRAKISIHHPTATPAAIAADTLNLGFLDFALDACVLDIPGLLALDSHYVIDTFISAMLAVAVIEDDALVSASMTFEPPPRTPLPSSNKVVRRASLGSSSTTSRNPFKRSGTKREEKRSKKAEIIEEIDDMGPLGKGTLAILGLGFKVGAFVVVTGVKVGIHVVVGVGKFAAKHAAEHQAKY